MPPVRFPVGPADLPSLVPNDQGWMHDVEVAILVGFAVVLAYRSHPQVGVHVLEVGCYRGRTTSGLLMVPDLFLTVVDNFKGPTDHPEEQGLREAFEDNIRRAYVTTVRYPGAHAGAPPPLTVLEGDSAEVLPRMRENGDRFDLILLDGDHRREAVRADIQNAWPLLLEGGYLFLDDINWDSVRDGIRDAWGTLGDAAPRIIPATNKLGYVRKVGGRPVA